MKGNLYLTIIVASVLLFTSCSNIQLSNNNNNIKKFNYSALHIAVRLNNLNLVKKLLNKRDLDLKDKFQDTPLIDAVRNNYTSISKILICYGANTNVKDMNNLSLIDIATRNENIELLSMLQSNDKKSYCTQDIKNIIKENTIFDNTSEVLLDLNTKINNNTQSIQNNNDNLNNDNLNNEIPINERIDNIDEINLENSNSNLKSSLYEIILNDNIKFNKNNSTFEFKEGDLTSIMKNDLSFFITQLNTIISNHNISRINIYVYTSSEYRTKSTKEAKDRANKRLSQKRANKIRNYIINISKNKTFMRKRLNAIGLGAVDLIYDEYGIEDKVKSKRTVLEIIE